MNQRRNPAPTNGSELLAFLLLLIMFLVLGLIAFREPPPDSGASRLNTCTTDTECETMYPDAHPALAVEGAVKP